MRKEEKLVPDDTITKQDERCQALFSLLVDTIAWQDPAMLLEEELYPRPMYLPPPPMGFWNSLPQSPVQPTSPPLWIPPPSYPK